MMRRVFAVLGIAVLALALAATFTPSSRIYPRIFRGTPGRVLAQLAVELPCPTGDAPAIFAGSVTRNPATDSVRYNFCVTSTGHLFFQGDGGAVPGGANTAVQFNNAGAFGGTSSFTYDGSTTVTLGNGGAAALVLASSANSATSGALRLPSSGGAAKTSIAWRNGANNADLNLLPDATDKLQFAGTGVCLSNGTNCPSGTSTVYNTIASAAAASIGSTTMVTAPASDTNYEFGAFLSETVATAGCSTQPSFQIEIIFTDAFTGASRTALPLVNQLGNGGTFNNAQSFAAALSAATTYTTHLTLRAKASTTLSYTVVYSVGVGCTTGASYSIAPVLVQQ